MARKLLEKLEDQAKSTERVFQILSRLSERVSELQESHEEVKNKSLVMQSLWDGLVTRQSEFGSVLDGFGTRLEPFAQYEELARVLGQREGQDPLSAEHCKAVEAAVRHVAALEGHSDYLDGPLYRMRYSQLLQQSVKVLLAAVLGEVDSVTKLSSARFRGGTTLKVLADVNADYLVTCSKVGEAVQVLGICGDRKEFGDLLAQVASKYFSCRSSLLHYFFLKYAEDEADPAKSLVLLIELIRHVLREERVIADRLFGELFPSFAIQYKQFTESFLVGVLKRIRTIYEENGSPPVKSAMQTVLEGLRGEHRVFAVLHEWI